MTTPSAEYKLGEELLFAAKEPDVKEVERILKSGAKVNYQNKYGRTPLYWASSNGHHLVVVALLNAKANPDLPQKDGEWTPLHIACKNGRQAVVEVLLARKANHTMKDTKGRTALDVAQEEKHNHVVKLFDFKEAWQVEREKREKAEMDVVAATAEIEKLKKQHGEEIDKMKKLLEDSGYSLLEMDEELDMSKLKITDKVLGSGNFGQVRLGTIGSVEVAVKMIKPLERTGLDKKMKAALDKAEQDFDKEIRTWTKLPRHGNVARLIGVVDEEGSQAGQCKAIVMPLYRGGTLKEELDTNKSRGSTFTKLKSLSILSGIANGLKHLHRNNIVHRDLAARNILFETKKLDRAIVTDFGLSREVSEEKNKEYYKMTQSGSLPLAWLPPETLVQGKSTVKSDVWSYGVLVWELITEGATPFQGLSGNQMIVEVGTGKLPDILLDRVKGADSDLVALVKMCLVMDSEKRPSSDAVAKVVNDMLVKCKAK